MCTSALLSCLLSTRRGRKLLSVPGCGTACTVDTQIVRRVTTHRDAPSQNAPNGHNYLSALFRDINFFFTISTSIKLISLISYTAPNWSIQSWITRIACLSACLSTCRSACLSVCLSVCFPHTLCLLHGVFGQGRSQDKTPE